MSKKSAGIGLGIGLALLGGGFIYFGNGFNLKSPASSDVKLLTSKKKEADWTTSASMPAKPSPRSRTNTPPIESVTKTPSIDVPTSNSELPPNISSEIVSLILLMQARYASGDFDGSLSVAEKILAEAKDEKKIVEYVQAQLPAILVSAGWTHIQFSRYQQAIELFKRSRTLTPTIQATKGLALSYYKLNQNGEALEETENYLKSDPSDESMLVILSDLFESQNKFEEALLALERAEQKIIEKKSLPNLNPQLQEELKKNFTIVSKQKRNMTAKLQLAKNQRSEQGGIFKLTYSEIEHDILAGWTLNFLQEALDDLTQTYGFKIPKEPIEVILYEQKDFLQANEDSPQWADGLFNGRIRVPIYPSVSEQHQLSRLRKVLSHELVHALFSHMTNQRSLPPWFDEGMAQRFSCFPAGCKPVVFQLSRGSFLPPEDFEKPFLSAKSLKAQRLYQQSLYLVLTLEYLGGPEILRSIIESIKTDSNLHSESLLKPFGSGFLTLHEKASELWKSGHTFPP